jgi:hypothetical protein
MISIKLHFREMLCKPIPILEFLALGLKREESERYRIPPDWFRRNFITQNAEAMFFISICPSWNYRLCLSLLRSLFLIFCNVLALINCFSLLEAFTLLMYHLKTGSDEWFS